MSNIHDTFNKLVENKKVVVRTNSIADHELLRIRLCKYFARHKNTLESIGYSDSDCILSVSAEYSIDSGNSTFFLRIRKNGPNRNYEIIEEASGGEPR